MQSYRDKTIILFCIHARQDKDAQVKTILSNFVPSCKIHFCFPRQLSLAQEDIKLGPDVQKLVSNNYSG